MRIAGMMRLSEIDQRKLGNDIMKFAIKEMSAYTEHLYFLKIGTIDEDIISFIESLDKPFKITNQTADYLHGWMFRNNESLDDLYKTVDKGFDWVMYPDADDILPENILEIVKSADQDKADVIRLHFIETFGDVNKIIKMINGFPIGPHFKGVRMADDITFIGSDGFNEPTTTSARNLKRHESEYCMRHLRYCNQQAIEERQKMNYYQDYFLQNHELIDYKPMQKRKYYE